MSIAPAARRRRILGPGINLTPLLDAILNLTFFFLVATTLRKQEGKLNVALPPSETASTASGSTKPTVTLDSQGKIFFEDRELSESEFETRMRQIVADGKLEVDIRGDKTVEFGRVVRVMDLCKKSGVQAANWIAIGEGGSAP